MIKIGIIGSSSISSKFCNAVNTQAENGVNFALVANYSRNLEQAEVFASEHNIENSYDDKLKMLKTIDLVYIATPNSLHFEDVKLALNNHTHVIIEKPMTTSKAQTTELFELAQANNLVLVEAIKTCSMETYQHLKANISKLGQLKSYRLNMMRDYGNFPTADDFPNIYKQTMAGGVINDLGSYALFPLIDFVYPEHDPSQIEIATISQNYGLDVEVELIANLRSKATGVHGLITLSMVNQDDSKSYIYGTKGYVTIDSLSQFNQVNYYDLDDNLLQTVTNHHNHLMASELLHTISLIENNQLASEIHNSTKSCCVATYLELLHKKLC